MQHIAYSILYAKYIARTLYPARMFFRIGEIKSFQDKQKLTEFMNTKLALQEVLKGTGHI